MKSNTALSLGIALAVSLGAILPATAATTAKPASSAPKVTHYYISLKAKGTGCEVVDVKPSTKMLVGKHSYKTEQDAQEALKDARACKV